MFHRFLLNLDTVIFSVPFTKRDGTKCKGEAIVDGKGDVLIFQKLEEAKKECKLHANCSLVVDNDCDGLNITLCEGQLKNETNSSCTYKIDDGMERHCHNIWRNRGIYDLFNTF